MKKVSLPPTISAGKLCYHFFAVVGMISSIGLLISWIAVEQPSADKAVFEPAAKDVNVSTAEAAAAVEAYRWRVGKDQSGMPKGYFISKDALMWLLQDQNFNGVYFYPGFNASGKFCLVAEGGRTENAGYRPVEGIEGKRIMSESLCPTDCGALTK